MPSSLRLLHLEPNEEDAGLVLALLAEEGLPCQTTRVTNLDSFIVAMTEGRVFDLILSDLSFAVDGHAALALARKTQPEVPFILVTGTSGEETAVEALKSGADDYVLKGRVSRLAPAVKRALTAARGRRERSLAEAALRSEHDQYRSLMDHIAIGIAMISPDMKILSLNREMEKWFPHADPSLRPTCYATFNSPPRNTVCGYCPVTQTFADGQVHEATTETPVKGGFRNYKVLASPVRDQDGRVVAVIEMVEDVTERKRGEEEIRHSNELLRAVVAASPLATVLLDPDGKVILWNAAAERIFGWHEEEVLGRLLPSVPEEKFKEFEDLRLRVLQGEFLAGVEIRRRRKDGGAIEVSLHAAPVFSADGSVTAIMSVMDDISQRKQIERELQESEKRFRAAFEDAVIGMCLTGLDGSFLTVNQAFASMLGFTPEELTALDLFQVTCPEDIPQSRRWIEGMLAGEILPSQMEKRFVARDGEVVWGVVSKKLLRDESGAPLHFVNQIQDITERKNLELQLLHAQKMEAVGTLAGGIAHDFNNVLTAIVGYGTLLQMKIEPGDPLAAHVESILAAADRASALTHSLLSFSRKRMIQTQPVDLNQLVLGIGGLLQRVLREDIEFRTRVNHAPVMGLADAGQLEQVLINLATNARDAMPAGGILVIETAEVDLDQAFLATHGYGTPGRYALLTISDNGGGMDPATRKRIFEPFFTTKEVGKGSGLGLSIVYGIVKQHQGFINCYSEPDRGTVFRIYLPTAEGKAEPSVPPTSALPSGGTETILLAEDDPWVRALTRDILERFGYSVIEAADGEEALVRFREHRQAIDLVLLDVIMPRRNGRETLAALRALRPGLPALFSSGYTADILELPESLGQEEGIGFLSKPVAPVELLAAIRRVLDQGLE